MRRIAAVLLAMLLGASSGADTICSSLLIMDPGADYISCTGHAAFLMRSEDLGLERCYSYESEPFGPLLARFLTGRLRMGMFRLPPEIFLEPYRADGRGVTEYRLNLPSEIGRELWRELDRRADEGIEQPYDYIRRGCSKAALECLMTAAERCGKRLELPPDRPYYHLTCREAFGRSIADYPWTFIALHLIVGTDVDDDDGPVSSRIHTPADLLDLLKGATIDGRPVLGVEESRLVPRGPPAWHPPISPRETAALLLAMAALCAFFPTRFICLRRTLAVGLLAVCTGIGLVTGYTVFLTDIPGTSWNWLLVPFNPLPALCWRWRRRWIAVYVALVSVWISGMLLSPHLLVDLAYVLLAASVSVTFIAVARARS